MTRERGRKATTRIAAMWPVGQSANRKYRHGACCLLAIAGLGAVVPALAADADAASVTDGDDSSGFFHKAGESTQQQQTTLSERDTAAALRQQASDYRAPDIAGLAYQPGFSGCVPEMRFNNLGGMGGLRSALAPLPLMPEQDSGRYVKLGVTVGETYTDNVELASNDEARSAWVTQVVPSLQACANTGRVKASLDYRLQALYYANGSESNKVYNNVAGATTVEMLPGHLFLAADTSYGQAVINSNDVFSQSNVLRPGNRTSAWITNVSPYWFQDLGPVGQGTLRYRYGRAQYGSSSLSDYTLNGVYVNVTNPPTNTLWSYQFNAATQRVKRDDSTSGALGNRDVTHYDSVALNLGYQLTESLQLVGMGGVEDDYKRDGSVDRLGSGMWNAGFRWTSPTNAVEARVGRRSFGSSYMAQATHHAALFDLTLAYREDTTGAGLNQLNRGNMGASGSFQGPLSSIQYRDRGVYVRKRLSARVGFDTARTRTTLQAYDESRDYLTTDHPDEDVYGAAIRTRYQAGVRTAVIPHFRWERQRSDTHDTDTARAGIGVTYLLTPSSQAAAGYSHTWRKGHANGRSYDENRITIQYSVFF